MSNPYDAGSYDYGDRHANTGGPGADPNGHGQQYQYPQQGYPPGYGQQQYPPGGYPQPGYGYPQMYSAPQPVYYPVALMPQRPPYDPSIPPVMPGAVKAANVIHAVMLALFLLAGTATAVGTGDVGLLIVFLVPAVITAAVGGFLWMRPGSASQIVATVCGALWVSGGFGILWGLPVLILLWAGQDARDYFKNWDTYRKAQKFGGAEHVSL